MYNSLLEKITFLNETSLESVKSKTETGIVSQFVEAGIKVLGADFGFSFIRDPGKRNFRLIYKSKTTPYEPAVPRSSGITAKAFRSKEPQLMVDVTKVGSIRADAKHYMKGVAVVPISYKKANYGALDFCFIKEHKFNEEEKILCQFVGNSTAEAITIHRLLEERKKVLGTREEFLALASHELKTPITSMKLAAQYLLSLAVKKGANYKEVEGLELINEQIDRLTKLVNDILIFNKSESRELDFKLEYFDISTLINESLKQLELIAKPRRVIYEGGKNLVVMGDKDKIEQVFNNLVSNAIKYSPIESKITLSAKKEKNQVVVSVKDEGSGIPKTMHKQIFERYFRGNRSAGGFGLGLYITKRLIEKHKGRIWVESKLGQGSTFYFSLPSKD